MRERCTLGDVASRRVVTKFVEAVRIDAACHALETTPAGVDAIAHATGLGTSETMRRAVLRRRGVTPSDHRDRFRLSPAI